MTRERASQEGLIMGEKEGLPADRRTPTAGRGGGEGGGEREREERERERERGRAIFANLISLREWREGERRKWPNLVCV